ncbi:MAG: teichoic acid D-Ala incorporation-associated protein DltX [Bombilactobacillus sp.]
MKFIAQTLFYFLIIMALGYLYSYAGNNNSGFIYNEF